MQILSQRDPRWANIKLGTSSETIGGYGCTITCISMIEGTTPDVTNEKLKAVGGYANGNLVIWDKIKEAFPNSEVHRVWNYNNDDVLANVPNVLVEVDGAPIGGYRHWVVFVGDHKLYDPWDGKEKATSTYPNPLSYCVVKPPKQQTNTISVDSATFENLVTKSTKYDEMVSAGYDSAQKVKDIIEGYQSRITTAERDRDSARSELAVAEEKKKQAEKMLADVTQECQTEVNSIKAQYDEIIKATPDLESLHAEYESQIGVLKDSITKLSKQVNTLKIDNAKLKQPIKDLPLWEKFKILFS